jgi:hypothetical protein
LVEAIRCGCFAGEKPEGNIALILETIACGYTFEEESTAFGCIFCFIHQEV